MLTTKKAHEEVVKPIQILNIQVDRVVGRGQKRRAERKQASLDFRVRLLAEIAKAVGFGMPRRPSESPHSSSDGHDYLDVRDAEGRQLQPTVEEYTAGGDRVVGRVVSLARELFATEMHAREVVGDDIKKEAAGAAFGMAGTADHK